jgi:hypothetical protein
MYIGRVKTDYGIVAGLRLDVRQSSFNKWERSALTWASVDPTCDASDASYGTMNMFEAMGRI